MPSPIHSKTDKHNNIIIYVSIKNDTYINILAYVYGEVNAVSGIETTRNPKLPTPDFYPRSGGRGISPSRQLWREAIEKYPTNVEAQVIYILRSLSPAIPPEVRERIADRIAEALPPRIKGRWVPITDAAEKLADILCQHWYLKPKFIANTLMCSHVTARKILINIAVKFGLSANQLRITHTRFSHYQLKLTQVLPEVMG